jgi:hypothetical protein
MRDGERLYAAIDLLREEVRCISRRVDLLWKESRHELSTRISFTEITMLPVEAGNTLIYTGTLAPPGSILAPDAVVKVTSNDPNVSPTVDSTGLIVSVPLPSGWVESETNPLAISYSTTSASTSQALSATITPGAEIILATGVSFAQTT